MTTKNTKYLLITEAAIDLMLVRFLFDDDNGLPKIEAENGLRTLKLSDQVQGYAAITEPTTSYSALISIEALNFVIESSKEFYWLDLYGRINRIVKALANPPIHLPRSWSEFHYKNRVSFFALPHGCSSSRWIADIDGQHHCVRFSHATTTEAQTDLINCELEPWPVVWDEFETWRCEQVDGHSACRDRDSFAEEVDLKVIGSSSIIQHRTFEQWLNLLTDNQKQIIDASLDKSIRIIGPAGSGKTLALCLRAFKAANDLSVVSSAKKLLIITHTWAMAERIDGTLTALFAGQVPESVTVLPLLYLLQLYGPQISKHTISVLGDDSKTGRVASLEIIQELIPKHEIVETEGWVKGVSDWIREALLSSFGSHQRNELVLNLYEEMTGVLSAEGIGIDDESRLQQYLSSPREDWMPPFSTIADRRFVLKIYTKFLSTLSDRGAVTTDQLIQDSIRMLETFTWRMRREAEGYDFIFVDELQLFGPQERLAIELLARNHSGGTFTTAEDPSQGVFSAVNARAFTKGIDTSVFLESTHRFDPPVFKLIEYIYHRFPLNTIPLRVSGSETEEHFVPVYYMCDNDGDAVTLTVKRVSEIMTTAGADERICVVSLGDIEEEIYSLMENMRIPVVQLKGYDDVEKLSYRRKSVVVSPWQFIGGTQFTHVIVVTAGTNNPKTSFDKLRELTSIYVACSRAVKHLELVCGPRVPTIISEASDQGLLKELHD